MMARRRPRQRPARVAPPLVAALLLLIAVGGCGFQPRGQAVSLAAVPGPVHVSGIARYSPLWRELTRQLEQGGATLADNAASAQTLLRISAHVSDARVFSVDSRNKAVEYELEEAVRFSLRTAGQEQASADQTVRVLRILYQPQDAVLGSNREADLMRADMRRELAERVVRRLAAR